MKSKRPMPWQPGEDELIVCDYIEMLNKQLAGVSFNKSATRRALLPKLYFRTEGSIEMKRMNISAVLRDLGQPFIIGYKPASNYQKSLKDCVQKHLSKII
jgi:hypothetical protein